MTATLELEKLQNCRNNGGSGFFIAESSAASSKTWRCNVSALARQLWWPACGGHWCTLQLPQLPFVTPWWLWQGDFVRGVFIVFKTLHHVSFPTACQTCTRLLTNKYIHKKWLSTQSATSTLQIIYKTQKLWVLDSRRQWLTWKSRNCEQCQIKKIFGSN